MSSSRRGKGVAPPSPGPFGCAAQVVCTSSPGGSAGDRDMWAELHLWLLLLVLHMAPGELQWGRGGEGTQRAVRMPALPCALQGPVSS